MRIVKGMRTVKERRDREEFVFWKYVSECLCRNEM